MGQGNSLAHAKREVWGLSLKKVLVGSRSRRIFENHENHGLGPVWGPFTASFGRKIDVGAVLRTMFLRQMACRDGFNKTASLQAILFSSRRSVGPNDTPGYL